MSFLDIVRRKVAPTQRAGVGGAQVTGGYLVTNETSALLTGRSKYKVFSDLLANTSIVSAGLRHYLNLISKASWKVQPVEETDGAKKAAELVESILYDMETPLHKVVSRAAMYRFYGFSCQEWIAKKRKDGAIGLLGIEARPQMTIERWDLDNAGKVKGVVQRSPQTDDELYIPRGKMLYMVEDSLNDTPEGLGLLRHVVEPARRLARMEQLEGYGFETDLRGVPIGRVPYAALQEMVDTGKITAAQKAAAEQTMVDFIDNHIKSPALGLLLDSMTYQSRDDAGTPSPVKQWDMELLQAQSTSQAEVAAAISRLNREVARVLGVEGLLLGESTGSFAMSKDKSSGFALTVDSALREITSQAKMDVVNTLMRLNGIDEELAPELSTESVHQRDVTEITAALRDLAMAGLDPEDPCIAEIREMLGLSRQIVVTDPQMTLGAKPPPPPPPASGGNDGAKVKVPAKAKPKKPKAA